MEPGLRAFHKPIKLLAWPDAARDPRMRPRTPARPHADLPDPHPAWPVPGGFNHGISFRGQISHVPVEPAGAL